MIDIDDISSDAMDFVDLFCSLSDPLAPEAKSALRQAVVGAVVAYLKNDTACNYETSKRALKQTWDDYKPAANLSTDQTLVEQLHDFCKTSTYKKTLPMFQNKTPDGYARDISQGEVQSALLAYMQHYKEHQTFNNMNNWKNHLLGSRYLSDANDQANSKILQEAAIHALTKKGSTPNHQNAQELLAEILSVIKQAHHYRHNLAAALTHEQTHDMSAEIKQWDNLPALIAGSVKEKRNDVQTATEDIDVESQQTEIVIEEHNDNNSKPAQARMKR